MEEYFMKTFNDGKPYHGSYDVFDGKLRGSTDKTDYFYFVCPKCPGDEIVRILEYGVHAPQKEENEYNELCKSKAKYGFILVFKLHCEKCSSTDFVKISNIHWQNGQLSKILALYSV